jgi:hypothetical protein
MRFTYESAADEFAKQAEAIRDPIAKATTLAIREAAQIIRTKGRSDIAAAGFPKRWQVGLRVDTKPEGRKYSIDAEANVYHRIPYADVFERGATIRGKPMLWLPLPSTPKKIRGKRVTPKRFVREVGPLVSMKNAAKPLLGAPMVVPLKRQTNPRVTLAGLKRGATAKAAGQSVRTVPIFIGIPTVTLRDRFSISPIIRQTAADIVSLYSKHLEAN